MRHVRLHFHRAELIGLHYHNTADHSERVSVRGKTSGAYRGAGTFQWTMAVRALCAFLLHAVEQPEGIHLSGVGGSLAASLDYALSKQPAWLIEIFGADAAGICNARRFVFRTNSERKRPGPVSLSLNHTYLPSSHIEVWIDGEHVTDITRIRALRLEVDDGVSESSVLAAA